MMKCAPGRIVDMKAVIQRVRRKERFAEALRIITRQRRQKRIWLTTRQNPRQHPRASNKPDSRRYSTGTGDRIPAD